MSGGGGSPGCRGFGNCTECIPKVQTLSNKHIAFKSSEGGSSSASPAGYSMHSPGRDTGSIPTQLSTVIFGDSDMICLRMTSNLLWPRAGEWIKFKALIDGAVLCVMKVCKPQGMWVPSQTTLLSELQQARDI